MIGPNALDNDPIDLNEPRITPFWCIGPVDDTIDVKHGIAVADEIEYKIMPKYK